MEKSGASSELETMFDHLDLIGNDGRTVQVSLSLHNTSMMTIRAGGPGVHAWPAFPPFESFEVLITDYPPKIWNKYSDEVECMYDRVPRLLICDHIIASGGMYGLEYQSQQVSKMGMLDLKIAVPETAERKVFDAIKALTEVRLISSTYHLRH